MAESLQKKKRRIRPPRVQIEYDVYIGDALKMKELPFVVGVMGDFSGKPKKPLGKLDDRKFTTIDRDNFQEVLAAIAPRLAYQVDDKLSGEKDKMLNIELTFKNMKDFTPEQVVRQIPALRELLEQRDKLKNLLARMEGNDKLEDLLEKVLKDTASRDELASALGIGGGSDTAAAPERDASSEPSEPTE